MKVVIGRRVTLASGASTDGQSPIALRRPVVAEVEGVELTPPPGVSGGGAAAAFNRLVSGRAADVYVLIESAATLLPDALARLVDCLLADPRNGLAGPSTNRGWNEQACLPHGGAGDVEATAAAAARRFGDTVATLRPLHSLSDFCYAVRREVIETIGGADEGYGNGPCWEMEYNIRAARAGFRALWVCGAYVYRAPLTERRAAEEGRLFEASRRRYQDSVCALKLRGMRAGYEPHCRGEDCEHFAPAQLMRIHRPLSRPATATAGPRTPAAPTRDPLVSCIMPTGGRPEFARQAVHLFKAQDYAHRELIVVDDGTDGLGAVVAGDERIRYVRSRPGETIGDKRNRACELARGAFIAEWDDDDWYASHRLSAQLEPLRDGRADVTGLADVVILDLAAWQFWRLAPWLRQRLFLAGVPSGTLVFRRELWRSASRYPALSVAEDAVFLRQALRRGARLEPVEGHGLFIYVRHGANTWRFACGQAGDPSGWHGVPAPALPSDDLRFYERRGTGAPAARRRAAPLVSCVMPTHNRRRLVVRAIAYFEHQDYPERELIVLDDGDDRVADLIPPDARIRYACLEQRLSLGAKRNRACELARGEIIVNWDDDDWHAPHRISYQVRELERHRAEMCGAGRILYFDPAASRSWLFEYPLAVRRWVAGGTLCFEKALWRRNPYPDVPVGEDTRFVWSPAGATPHILADHRFYAALIHPANTSRKETQGAYWTERPIAEVRALLGEDYRFYEAGR